MPDVSTEPSDTLPNVTRLLLRGKVGRGDHASMTSRVLALDLATTTGWAVDASGIVTSGSQCFRRFEGARLRRAQHIGEPFASFHRWLAEKIRTDKPDVIVYEEAGFFKSVTAVRIAYGLRGILYAQAAARALPVTGYAPAAVKKHWTGKGNAQKPAMIAAARRRHPEIDLTDDNEADALALLSLHRSLQVTAYETQGTAAAR